MPMGDFPDLPERMQKLPVDHRGFPVPWFVPWQDGKPIFPAFDRDKWVSAVRVGRCWVCGEIMGRFKHHVVGPMGLINQVSAEPPSHHDCAQFAARHCPYIANPRMGRVPQEKYGTVDHPGTMDNGNPGVWCVIETHGPILTTQTHSGPLIRIAPIADVQWWALGRRATPHEVEAGFEERVARLRYHAKQASKHERDKLELRIEAARDWLPKEKAA